jgi:hypothetical protein
MNWKLDEAMPVWTYNETHSKLAQHNASDVISKIPNITWNEVPSGHALMDFRMKLQPKKKNVPQDKIPRLRKDDHVFDILLNSPAFAILYKSHDEFVFGGFYPLKHGFQFPKDDSADKSKLIGAFRDAAVPGAVKVAAEFALIDGKLVTETRVQPTSAKENKWFRFYWMFIRAGSGLLRRVILKAALKQCNA